MATERVAAGGEEGTRHPPSGAILEEILSAGKQLASANFRAGRRAGFFGIERNGPRVSPLIPVIASAPCFVCTARSRNSRSFVRAVVAAFFRLDG